MTFSKAEEFRLQAKKCLDQAEIDPNPVMKKRMRWLADEWLMAFQAALEDDGTTDSGQKRNQQSPR